MTLMILSLLFGISKPVKSITLMFVGHGLEATFAHIIEIKSGLSREKKEFALISLK